MYEGSFTQGRVEQFRGITKVAAQQFLNSKVDERLKTALNSPQGPTQVPPPVGPEEAPTLAAPEVSHSDIVTTAEEREAFYIVKSILRDTVPPARIAMRDAKSYCSVLLDDNNRKPICRFHFSSARKFLSVVMDETEREERFKLSAIDDIFGRSDLLKQAAALYN